MPEHWVSANAYRTIQAHWDKELEQKRQFKDEEHIIAIFAAMAKDDVFSGQLSPSEMMIKAKTIFHSTVQTE